jgi:ubiquinol-cytochrome c reductase cytochrome c1 subunit
MTLISQRSFVSFAAAALTALGIMGSSVSAAEGGAEIHKQSWTFGGMTGHFDRAQLRRGYAVYKGVCSACHGLKYVYFRNLGEPGGPEFSDANVEEFAAAAQVTDGPNDDGEMFQRPGKPADRMPSPYPNDKAAAAAQNGAIPPDLSVMAKARTYERHASWYLEPFNWIADIFTAYQEQGPDYLYALMTGYAEAPAGFQLAPGMNYNKAFPGHQIAMPNPLSDGQVEYADGTPATVENYARDVTAFLMWTAEPKLEERKKMGLKVLVYLIILAGLLYLSKRALWRNVEH